MRARLIEALGGNDDEAPGEPTERTTHICSNTARSWCTPVRSVSCVTEMVTLNAKISTVRNARLESRGIRRRSGQARNILLLLLFGWWPGLSIFREVILRRRWAESNGFG